MSAAKPMRPDKRARAYMRQNGTLVLTHRQARRFFKKANRYLKKAGGGEE